MSTFRQASNKFMLPMGASASVIASSFLGQKTSNHTCSRVSKKSSSVLMEHLKKSSSASFSTSTSISKINGAFTPYRNTLKQNQSLVSSLHRQRRFSATATNPAVDATKSRGFLAWYEGHLQAHPVITKMVSGSFLWGLGDAVAQVVPTLFSNDEEDLASGDKQKLDDVKSSLQKEFIYDFERTARAVFFGFAIHAPTSHLHFNFLEWMTVRAGFTGIKIPIFKAFMEQFVYWSWISNSMYHGAMGAMQGMNSSEIYSRIENVLWDTQKAQWVFWIPVQLLNFQFVPVRHQLNVVLLTSVVWTALLSAWYPPEDDSSKEEPTRKIEEQSGEN